MRVITISREYGAGGHSIGTETAKKLGIEFYDRDILMETAKRLGIDSDVIKQEEEKIRGSESFIRMISPLSYDQTDAIYDYQRQIILDIASKEPCVILGRCADVICRDAGIPSLDVFLFADNASRVKRVSELINTDDVHTVIKTIKKADHERHSYYMHYTGKHWGDFRNYHLMLDTGLLGYDTCVKIICEAALNAD